MIFQAVEDEAGNTSRKVSGVFSQMRESIDAILSKPSTASTITFGQEFEDSLQLDLASMDRYNSAIDSGMSATEALAYAFTDATMRAKEFAGAADGAIVNTEQYAIQSRQAQISTQAQDKSLSNINALITEYNAILSSSAESLSKSGLTQKEYLEAIKQSNPQLAKYLSGLQAADGTTKGYVGSLISAKLATIGVRIETMALNAIMGAGIGLLMSLLSMGLQSAIEAIADALKDPKEALKELDEELSSLQSTIQSTARDFSDLKKNSDEIIPRFAELAKGVDEFGNRLTDTNGKMMLTDEEYEEFWELNNKIAEMFPELDAGLDSNGNHILSLSYSVDTYAEITTDSANIPLGIAYDRIVGINGVAKLNDGRYVFIQSINPDTYDGTYMEIQGNFLSITILSTYAEATITLQ